LIYETAFTSFDFGQAAAIGIVLAAIIVVVSVIQFRLPLATLPVIGLFFLFRKQFMAGTSVTGTGIQ
jgi:hypothetical protein